MPGDPTQLLASYEAFAATSVAEGYSVAFPAFAADAAIVTTRRDYRWNRSGVELFWAGWTPAERFDWQPALGAAAGSGDLGFTVGNATFDFTDGDVHAQSRSKYVTVWVRSADGAWRWLVDDGNDRP